MFSHMLDIAFTIETPIEDWREIPLKDLVEALQSRVDYIRENMEQEAGAFGYSDSYEIEKVIDNCE